MLTRCLGIPHVSTGDMLRERIRTGVEDGPIAATMHACTQNRLRPHDIEKIVGAYKKFETVEKYAYRATYEQVKGNDFNLNIPRYVDSFEEEDEVDIPATQKEIERLEGELAEVRAEMKRHLQELGL